MGGGRNVIGPCLFRVPCWLRAGRRLAGGRFRVCMRCRDAWAVCSARGRGAVFLQMHFPLAISIALFPERKVGREEKRGKRERPGEGKLGKGVSLPCAPGYVLGHEVGRILPARLMLLWPHLPHNIAGVPEHPAELGKVDEGGGNVIAHTGVQADHVYHVGVPALERNVLLRRDVHVAHEGAAAPCGIEPLARLVALGALYALVKPSPEYFIAEKHPV